MDIWSARMNLWAAHFRALRRLLVLRSPRSKLVRPTPHEVDFISFLKKVDKSLKSVTGFATSQQMTAGRRLFSYLVHSDSRRKCASAGSWERLA